MPKVPTGSCNFNTPSGDCTYTTCCLKQGSLDYLPTVPGNAIYAAALVILLVLQLWLGIRAKTWSFMSALCIGIFGEIVGYLGRIWMAYSIFNFNAFLVNLVPLTISPAFLTAGIYLCLSRVVTLFDPTISVSRLKPMTYTKIFITLDFISLLLQAAGGAIASIANTKKTTEVGVNVMIAGLAFQVFSIIVFSILCADFGFRVWKAGMHRPTGLESYMPGNAIRGTGRVNFFIYALVISTILIFIRSVFRLIELQGGFNGKLANDQVLFMIFEGPMIIGALTLLTVWHPATCLGDFWQTGKYKKIVQQQQQPLDKMNLTQDSSSEYEPYNQGENFRYAQQQNARMEG